LDIIGSISVKFLIAEQEVHRMGKGKVIVDPKVKPEDVASSASRLNYVNHKMQQGDFVTELGLNITSPADPIAESAGVPRIFLVKDGKVSSLAEKEIALGSRQFWQEVALGRVFAYPAGERYPVQASLENPTSFSPDLVFSAALDPQKMPETDAGRKPRTPRWYHRVFRWGNNRRICREYDSYIENRKRLEARAKADAEAIEKEFGSKRTEDVLRAEKTEGDYLRNNFEKLKREKRLKTDIERIQNGLQKGDDMIDIAVSLYGPVPKLRPELTAPDPDNPDPSYKGKVYTKKQFDTLRPIDISGMQIGGKAVTDREFAALAYSAGLDPKIGMEAQNSVADPSFAVNAVLADGYTREEVEEMVTDNIHEMYGRTIMIKREQSGSYIEPAIKPAREKAAEALQAYQNGDRAPMAEILSRMVVGLGTEAATRLGLDQDVYSQNRLAETGLDLMERDPELKEMVRQNYERHEQEFSKRHPDIPRRPSFEEQTSGIRQVRVLEEMKQKSEAGKLVIAEATAKGVELTAKEKQQYAGDILKYNVARYRYLSEVGMSQSINEKVGNQKLMKHMQHAAGLPNEPGKAAVSAKKEGASSAPVTAYSFESHMLNNRFTPKPVILQQVADPDRMAELGAGVDNLIEKDGLDKLSTAELTEKLVRGDGYENNHLADRFMRANPQQMKQPDRTAVKQAEQQRQAEEQVLQMP